MPAVSPSRGNGALLVALLFAQLLLMSFSARGADGATAIERVAMRVSAPVVDLADYGGHLAGNLGRSVAQLYATHSRNALLEQQVRGLRAELTLLREAELQNARLRRLLEMRSVLTPRAIGATVVTAVDTGETKLVVIDRGSAHGVRVDLPVVSWGGAVGRVVAVEARHAKVRLLDDPSSGVAGVVQRSRAQGVVLGQGAEPLRMKYLARFSDVQLGDRVVTSGLDGVFPRGFGIGTVTHLAETADGSQEIQLVAEADFRALEEVLVLLEPVAGALLSLESGSGS